MQDRPLDYALETERRLGVDVVFAFDRRCVLADELGQVAAQLFDVAARRPQGLRRGRIVE